MGGTSDRTSNGADAPRRRLTRSFYRRTATAVAADLPGRVLCRRVAPGRVLRATIVEVEAYGDERDRASHARCGPTARNAPMFRAGGVAYVYLIYGMHHCVNVVVGGPGRPAAVLIRATEPPQTDARASGPGLVCRAFEIDRSLDGTSLLGRTLWLESGAPPSPRAIRRTARIGVGYAGACARRPWRFVIRDDPHASGPRALR